MLIFGLSSNILGLSLGENQINLFVCEETEMRLRRALLVVLIAAGSVIPALAQTIEPAAFKELKKLVGQWSGKDEKGSPTQISYQLVSGGTALMESTHATSGSAGMITIYHPDGNRVMMTHYCEANNQPRMRAEPAAGKTNELTFSFMDVTNLTAPTTGHMHGLTIRFEDSDHFSQTWTWKENGKDTAYTFHWTRLKK